MTDTTISIWNATHKQLSKFATKCGRWREFCEVKGVNAASVKQFQLKEFLSDWEGIEEITITDTDGDATKIEDGGKAGGDGHGDERKEHKGDGQGDGDGEGDDQGDDTEGEGEPAKELSPLEQAIEDAVQERVKQELEELDPSKVTIIVKDEASGEDREIEPDTYHYKFQLMRSAVQANVPVIMVGPAGTGKTHATMQAAKVLALPYYVSGAVASEFKLTGFKDAYGNYNDTQWRRAFDAEGEGGLFSWDEFDRSVPAALMCTQSGVANNVMDFPDKVVQRHPNMRLVATANTFGRGADVQYTSANKLDAATLDRYVTIEWDYDAGIEAAIIGIDRPSNAPDPVQLVENRSKNTIENFKTKWFNRVMAQRDAYDKQHVKEVCSTRALMHGIKLFQAGWPTEYIEEGILWRGMKRSIREKVEQHVKSFKAVV